MNVAFANGMINKLCKCFFYHQPKEIPCIQVGKPFEDLVFWLTYNDEGVAQCASVLIKKYGQALGVRDLNNARKLLLDFCSEAFSCIDANFISLDPYQNSVDVIITRVHRKNLSEMFRDYILSRINVYPYIYNIGCIQFRGRLKLQDNLYLYGPGQGESLLSEIRSKADIKVPEGFFVTKDMRNEPIGKYFNESNSVVILTFASSQQEAVEILDRLFGALCVTVRNPFAINSCNVSNNIEGFNDYQYHTSNFRVNLPSLINLDIDGQVSENLEEIFSKSNKRIFSALSFIAHGWKLDDRERFLNQFIALDAMYGNNAGNKSAIIGGVCRDAKDICNVSSKIEIIYELRCNFVHGDIHVLSNHAKYLSFIELHNVDPIESLFEIVKVCVLNYQGVYEVPKIKKGDIRTLDVPVELLSDVKKMIEDFENKG